MASKLELANAALDAIGEDPIVSLTANVPKALVIGRQWEFALLRLLRDHPWNWAKTMAAFDLVTGTPLLRWTNQFEVPNNLVTLLAINGTYPDTPSDLWEIVRMNGQRLLLTDQDEANCEYIYKPTDSELESFLEDMDPLGADALVTLLAFRIATKIAKDGRQMAVNLLQQYLTVDLPKAKVRNANESRRYPERPYSTSLNAAARFGNSNG